MSSLLTGCAGCEQRIQNRSSRVPARPLTRPRAEKSASQIFQKICFCRFSARFARFREAHDPAVLRVSRACELRARLRALRAHTARSERRVAGCAAAHSHARDSRRCAHQLARHPLRALRARKQAKIALCAIFEHFRAPRESVRFRARPARSRAKWGISWPGLRNRPRPGR